MKLPDWVIPPSELKEEESFPCRLCKGDMVLRTNKTTGCEFWGCSNFPKCKHTEEFSPGDDWDDDVGDDWHPGHPSNYGDR